MNGIPIHESWKPLSFPSTIIFEYHQFHSQNISLFYFLSQSLQLIVNLDLDQLFLDAHVINGLTGWYPCLPSFARLLNTFFLFLRKTLYFFPAAKQTKKLLKSTYLLGNEKGK